MKTLVAAILAVQLAAAGTAFASPFGCWGIISGTEGSTGTPWVGEQSLYITLGGFTQGQGFDRFEFSFTGDLIVVDVIPLNGTWNEGTVEAPSIVFPECGLKFPSFAVEIRVIDDGSGGTLCLTESSTTGRLSGFHCYPGQPEQEGWIEMGYEGFTSDGSAPCEGGPVSVEANSWGQIKSAYR